MIRSNGACVLWAGVFRFRAHIKWEACTCSGSAQKSTPSSDCLALIVASRSSHEGAVSEKVPLFSLAWALALAGLPCGHQVDVTGSPL